MFVLPSTSAEAQTIDQSSDQFPVERVTALYQEQLEAYKAGDGKAAVRISAELLEIFGQSSERGKQTYAFALNNHGLNLQQISKVEEASRLFRESWELYTRLQGEKTVETLQSLHNYIATLDALGKLNEADALFPQLISGRREVLGEEHPHTLVSLGNYAYLLSSLGRYTEALPIAERVSVLSAKVNGPENPSTLASRNNHASLLQKTGKLAESRDSHTEILSLRQTHLGEDHPDTLISISNLANVEQALGRYQVAEPLVLKALALSNKIYGAEHPATLKNLNNQASLLEATGRLDEAAPIYASVLAIRQRLSGVGHPETIISLNNLAGIRYAQGKTDEALNIFADALEISRSQLGSTHPNTINALQNYASLLRRQDRLDEARPLFEEAVRIYLESVGPDHPDTLNAQDSLALALVEQGETNAGMTLLSTVLASRRKLLGPDHPDTIISLNNQASFLKDLGKKAEAEKIYAEALSLNRGKLGNKHPNTLVSISNYASILDQLERWKEAEALYLESLDLSSQVLDAQHPDIVERLGNLANNRLSQPDRAPIAIEQARAAAQIIQQRRAAFGFSPAEQAQIGRNIDRQSFYFRLLADAAWEAGSAKNVSENSSSNLLTEAFLALQESMNSSTTRAIAQSAARNLVNKTGAGMAKKISQREALTEKWLITDKERVASFANQDADVSSLIDQLRKDQDALIDQMKVLDEQLEKEAPAYFALVRPKAMNPKSAQNLLKADEAALIIVPTSHGTHLMLVTNDKLKWHRSDWTEEEIDAAVQRLLWDAGADIDIDTGLVAEWEDEGEGVYPFARAYAYGLYTALIEPIEPALEGKTHLFVAASGSLTSLPLGLLITEKPEGADGDPANLRNSKWLADAYALTVIPSLQSLQFLRQQEPTVPVSDSQKFIGFGDPVLEGKARTRGSSAKRTTGKLAQNKTLATNDLLQRGSTSALDQNAIRKMARLPGTSKELRAIWQAFGEPKDALFLGSDATEKRVKTTYLASANILSFATHGVVAGELQGNSEPGLILTPPDKPTDIDNGLLSASEVTGLRLNADWVILSACNTAAGDGSDGAPGLSGLARSFFFAGARNLLASHWPVRDDVAAKITVRTIEIARENPVLSRAQAFQEAMQEIRNDPSGDSETDTLAHPNAWAPFSLIGDR